MHPKAGSQISDPSQTSPLSQSLSTSQVPAEKAGRWEELWATNVDSGAVASANIIRKQACLIIFVPLFGYERNLLM